ncbi:MAG: hypothetical protein HOH33_10100 [Verrucomicrobia bacterium]|nr:hypothetical protein [Verrucomicrobiota bacterium]
MSFSGSLSLYRSVENGAIIPVLPPEFKLFLQDKFEIFNEISNCRTMNTLFRYALIAGMICSGLFATYADDLKVGAAAVKITPPLGIPLAGYYHERGSSGVHDDLFARAVVMEMDKIRAAIVSLDLISTRRPFVLKARELIESLIGIPLQIS